MDKNLSPQKILDLGFGFWGSKALLSAVELGLFTHLADGPMDSETLQTKLGLHPRSARDFLDSLVSLGMLEREGNQYRNTPETERFLDRRKPSYLGGILEMTNSRLFKFWDALTLALKTGQPQNEAKSGGDLFTQLYSDPERLKSFLRAMTGLSLGSGQAIAAKFDFKRYQNFTDVGAAQGGVAAQVALAHPHLKGAGFDLPQVGPIFEEYIASQGLSERIKFIPGNFMKDSLPQTEVLLMGHILHDWDLETKRMLLKKAFDALPSGGALIVHEAIIDDERRKNSFGLLMSLNMLIETPGGFDYTGEDCKRWMREAGFQKTYVEPLVGPDSMVVAIK